MKHSDRENRPGYDAQWEADKEAEERRESNRDNLRAVYPDYDDRKEAESLDEFLGR